MNPSYSKLIILCFFMTLNLLSANLFAVQQADIHFESVFNTGQYNIMLTQDNDGFLWFASYGRVVKYNAYELTDYTAGPDSLSSSQVVTVFVDSEGLIWFATLGGGLNLFNKETNTFTRYQHDPNNSNSLNSDQFHWAPKTIAEDGDGLIWIGTSKGLNSFDKKSNTFSNYQYDPDNPNSLSNDQVWTVHVDREGLIWIGTQKGLNKFDKKTRIFTHYQHDPNNSKSLSDNWVYAIAEDHEGFLWIGTKSGGLNQFNKKTNTFTHYRHNPNDLYSLAQDEVYSIMVDKPGDLWLGRSYAIEVGLEKFNRATQKFTRYQHDPSNPSSLSGDIVLSVFEDQSGILWVPDNKGNINKYDRYSHKFNLYQHDSKNNRSIGSNNVVCIIEDNQGEIWMGAFSGGLNKYHPETDDFTVYKSEPNNPDALTHSYVSAILEDSEDNFWVATYDGILNLFDKKTGNVIIRYQNDIAATVGARSLIEDNQNPNLLWYGTYEFGIFKFDKKTGHFTQYKHDANDPNSLSNNIVFSFFQDSDGVLWIPTQGGGLEQFDKNTGTFTHYKHNPEDSSSISGNIVNAFYKDSVGRFWVSIEDGGLNQFDKQKGIFTHYGKKQGFTTHAIRSILEDNAGYLWLSSDVGIFKFDPEQEQVVKNYKKIDGLQDDQFNTIVTGAFKSQDGQMWMAGVNGLNSFYPEKIKDNPYIPPVVLTSFQQNAEEVDFGKAIERVKEINLTWRNNFFEFEFAALNYTLPEKNQHAYLLEGFETKWNDIGTRRYGKYTNLPGGTYTLRLKGSNNDGIWNETGTSIIITITSPPWQRWWAYTLYTIAIILIIVIFVRKHQKKLAQAQAINERLRQADKLKDEFLANTSHELRTPLNGIIGIAESLLDGVTGELSEKTKTNLAMIVGSGKRLATLVNDILDFSKLKHKNLDLQLKPIGLREIVDLVLTLSRPLVLNKSVQLVNAILVDLPPAHADENRLQQILYNLIGNAIKFTESGTVEISAKVINSHLEMTISDTGIGIPEDKLDRIFESFEQAEGSTAREYGGTGLGLAVTKQLVQLHGGEIWVKSTVGLGSQFFLTLPIAEGETSQLSVEALSLSTVQAVSPVEVSSLTETTPDEVKATSEDQLNILIVDDEPVNLQVLNNYLSLQNYHIIQATSGLEALAFIEEGFKPDAILLDVMMPKMTGYEVTQKLREKWQVDEMPILLLTAKNRVADLVVGLESGANDYLTKPISKDELLARLKTHLQLKELKEETLQLALENERMKTELEVTRRLQQMILPKEDELEQVPNLDIAGFMEPADDVGGDYYDVIQHNGRILIGIGDVTGHGLESGMLMLMAQAGVRTLLENEEPDAVKFLNSLNGMIYKNVQERIELDKNLTLSLLEYQPPSQPEMGGVLRVSGRHEDIIVVRQGKLERIDTGDLGLQVGFIDDIAEFVTQIEITLNVGDVVILFTDGITEAENHQRKEYGIKRLCEVVEQNWQKSVTDIKQAVIDDVRQYIGDHKVFDDITLVVLKQK
jgi:signal transduction histidine kinase/serine phosphatase RsbU (regulator of sigma subunit)/ligand-binding sensor domain-containing protein